MLADAETGCNQFTLASCGALWGEGAIKWGWNGTVTCSYVVPYSCTERVSCTWSAPWSVGAAQYHVDWFDKALHVWSAIYVFGMRSLRVKLDLDQ